MCLLFLKVFSYLPCDSASDSFGMPGDNNQLGNTWCNDAAWFPGRHFLSSKHSGLVGWGSSCVAPLLLPPQVHPPQIIKRLYKLNVLLISTHTSNYFLLLTSNQITDYNYIDLCTYISMYVYMQIQIYICICIYVYLYILIYIYHEYILHLPPLPSLQLI